MDDRRGADPGSNQTKQSAASCNVPTPEGARRLEAVGRVRLSKTPKERPGMHQPDPHSRTPSVARAERLAHRAQDADRNAFEPGTGSASIQRWTSFHPRIRVTHLSP